MELFQELVFTISLSFVVFLLIVKLFSVSSSLDDGNSKESLLVEEKIEKEWVVCDSEKEGKTGYFEDQLKGSDKIDFGCFGDALGSGVVIGDTGSCSGGDDCYVFDESPERTELTEWPESNDADADADADSGSVRSDVGNLVESTGSLVQEDCVKSVDVEHVASFAIDVGEVNVDEEDEVFDDDWQGIETTELEKCFGAAVAFMDSKINAGRVNLIDNDVKIKNSWKSFENLGREDAMEQYVSLLSQHVPDWMGSHSSVRKFFHVFV
ncbi:hypothetical protein E3N88_05052 [Mikania micrantha]|uniref:ACB domain-containing protein n=1 Tax=Mikania micrantha TaxID=192012 RepID=A0A5N6PW73_9ASTR|nr:hypothetical protein E3N88_05052 [Mikania micrantha]